MKGYRTLLFNIALAVFGVLETFDWTNLVPADKEGLVLTAIGIVGAILRTRTTSPVGNK